MKVRRILILLVLAALIGGGAWLWMSRHPVPPARELVIYGNVDIRQVELAFQGTGRIESMNAKEGERVAEGQIVARLDAERLEHTVARVEAQIQAQEALVAKLERGSRPEEIRKARADVSAALAEAQNAEQLFQRRRPLAAHNAVSQEEADRARAASEAAQARLAAARETLQLVLEGPRKEDIAAAKATLQALLAESALARRELADAALVAPAVGVIQNRILEPGDMASSQKPVYILALTDPLWVRAYVPEPDLGKLRPGMAANVMTDSFPSKRYPGWIGFISPTAQFTPNSVETREVRTSLVYQVRVFVPNPEEELRLGMPATVSIPLDGSTPGSGPSSETARANSDDPPKP